MKEQDEFVDTSLDVSPAAKGPGPWAKWFGKAKEPTNLIDL